MKTPQTFVHLSMYGTWKGSTMKLRKENFSGITLLLNELNYFVMTEQATTTHTFKILLQKTNKITNSRIPG